MYSDRRVKQSGRLLWLILILLLLAAVILIFRDSGDLNDNSVTAIRSAVQRCALQCYTVEGAYPPDLKYLEDNYGLQVNEKDYYVTYDAFASNLPPTVVVTRR